MSGIALLGWIAAAANLLWVGYLLGAWVHDTTHRAVTDALAPVDEPVPFYPADPFVRDIPDYLRDTILAIDDALVCMKLEMDSVFDGAPHGDAA